MSEPEIVLPIDFEERRDKVLARLESGEAMTIQAIADALGVPFEFFALTVSLYAAARQGVPVALDDVSKPTTH